MEDRIVVAMWDRDGSVYTRPVVVDRDTKELKVNGKKPNKMIIPEGSKLDKKFIKKVNKLISYGGLVVEVKPKK